MQSSPCNTKSQAIGIHDIGGEMGMKRHLQNDSSVDCPSKPPLKKRITNFHSIADLISPSFQHEEKENAGVDLSTTAQTSIDYQNVPSYATTDLKSHSNHLPAVSHIPPVQNDQRFGQPDFYLASKPPVLTSTPKPSRSRPNICELNSKHLAEINRESHCITPPNEDTPASKFNGSNMLRAVNVSGPLSPHSSENENSGNRKKGRTIYKTHQVARLEQAFLQCQYPESDFIESLAKELDISENKVKVWFQNKRARIRRRGGTMAHKPPRDATRHASRDRSGPPSKSVPDDLSPNHPSWQSMGPNGQHPSGLVPGWNPMGIPQPLFNVNLPVSLAASSTSFTSRHMGTELQNSPHRPLMVETQGVLEQHNATHVDMNRLHRMPGVRPPGLLDISPQPHVSPSSLSQTLPVKPNAMPTISMPLPISMPSSIYGTQFSTPSSTTMHPSPLATLSNSVPQCEN